jgi:plasmid maintenance system antidote protein VapI
MTTALQDNFTVVVKTRLLENKTSITALARKLDLSRNYVSRAINNPIFPTARLAIARELKLKFK